MPSPEWPPPARKAASPALPPARPISPAAKMISGKRHVEEEDGDEGRGRDRHHDPLFSARRPMRTTASSTIASTAALRPKNSASTTGTSPRPAYSQESAMIATNPGSTNNVPATTPPSVRCSSQPMYTVSCCASGPGSSMQ